MEDIKLKKMTKNDIKLYRKALKVVSSFMTKKYNNIDPYKEKLGLSLEEFLCQSSNPKKVKKILEKDENNRKRFKSKPSKVVKMGVCRSKPQRGLFNYLFNFFGKNATFTSRIYVNDTRFKNWIENLHIAIHETNHADTNQYNETTLTTSHSGLKKTSRIDMFVNRLSGVGLNESMNELYAQICLYNTFPDAYENISSIDELVYSAKQPKLKDNMVMSGQGYRKLGILTKLLIIACDNSIKTSYKSLDNTFDEFIGKKVKVSNGEEIIKNDLIYAGKKHSKFFEEKFNDICGIKDAWEGLLIRFDILLEMINRGDFLNNKLIDDIVEIIDEFQKRRTESMIENGFWKESDGALNTLEYTKYKFVALHELNDYTYKPHELTDEDKQRIERYNSYLIHDSNKKVLEDYRIRQEEKERMKKASK